MLLNGNLILNYCPWTGQEACPAASGPAPAVPRRIGPVGTAAAWTSDSVCPYDCADCSLGHPLGKRHLGQPWPGREASQGGERHAMSEGQRALWGIRGAMSLGGWIRRGRLRAGVTARLALTPLPTHPIAKEKQAAAEEEGASAVIPSGCRPGGPVHMPCAPVFLPSTASGLGPEWGSSPQFSPVCGVPAAFGLRFPPANPAAVRS